MNSHVAVAPSIVLSIYETVAGAGIHDLPSRAGNVATRAGCIPWGVSTGGHTGDPSLAAAAKGGPADNSIACDIGAGSDEINAPNRISDLNSRC